METEWGYAVARLVEALPYNPQGRGIDSRCCNWNFSLTNPSGHTVALGSNQLLAEMGKKCIFCGLKVAGA